MMCLLLLTTACYVYLVNTTAMNGVRWGQAQQSTTAISSRVSALESTYLSLKQSVTLPLAYAKGFADVKHVTFIDPHKAGTVARATDF